MLIAAKLATLVVLVLKFVGLPAAILATLMRPRRLPGFAAAAGRAFRRAATYRRCCVIGVGLAAALVSMSLSLSRMPTPHFHDEYSFLLAADTYAQGRLTNPPHPLWRHFETFQVLQQPTYASIYPPVQGLMLALGQVVTGMPIAGIWLLQGLAAGAVCWMLQGWVRPRWALLGGLLVVLHAGFQIRWGQSYWGGSHALFGAALVYGALPRLRRHATVLVSLLLGLGVAVLANSRPYEGLVASLPAAAMLLWHVVGCVRRAAWGEVARIVLPAASVLLLTGAAMAHYFSSVTGDPLMMPYALVFRTYYASSMFLGRPDPQPQPEYSHEDLRRYFLGWAKVTGLRESTLPGFLAAKGKQLAVASWFFSVFYLALPALLIFGLLKRNDVRFAVAAIAFMLLAEMQVPHWQTHYLAPAMPLGMLLVVQGLRKLHAVRRTSEGHGGRVLAYAVVLLLTIDFGCLALVYAATPHQDFSHVRFDLAKRLQQTDPGKHVVIVRYGPKHSVHEDWVYNAADIDAAPVVWARDFGSDNQKLLEYYADRRVWLLEVDDGMPKLQAYKRPEVDARPLAQK